CYLLSHTPSSPLCPDTTLFRSTSAGDAQAGNTCQQTFPGSLSQFVRPPSIPLRTRHEVALLAAGRLRVEFELRGRVTVPKLKYRDRKSTRLNSSHVKISYAVFC